MVWLALAILLLIVLYLVYQRHQEARLRERNAPLLAALLLLGLSRLGAARVVGLLNILALVAPLLLRPKDTRARHGDASPPPSSLSREEAQRVLGVSPQAGETEIREAHKRLIAKIHPDVGGSEYLASQINRARDVLLGR